jgi:ParB family chromosome partitioning protein
MDETIRIDAIDASGRLRPIDPARAAQLAASIDQIGLQQPIVVRRAGEGFKLTAGAHRLEAFRLLGKTVLKVGVEVLIRDANSDEAELAEIDENIVRGDLNAMYRALFFAKRRDAYERMNATMGRGGDRKSRKFNELTNSKTLGFEISDRFTKDAADRVGLSEEAVRLALQIADGLTPEIIEALKDTRVAGNQSELLSLVAEKSPPRRLDIAKAIADGRAHNVATARVVLRFEEPAVGDPQGRVGEALRAAWKKADARTRRAFLKDINAEIVKKG